MLSISLEAKFILINLYLNAQLANSKSGLMARIMERKQK